MNKSELIDALAKSINQNANGEYQAKLKNAAGCVNIFFNSIKAALKEGDKVEIRGFASFSIKNYQSYTGRNPKTGEKVTVAVKKLPVFKAGKDLKDNLNNQ